VYRAESVWTCFSAVVQLVCSLKTLCFISKDWSWLYGIGRSTRSITMFKLGRSFNTCNLISASYIKYNNRKYIKKLNDITRQRKTHNKTKRNKSKINQTIFFNLVPLEIPNFFICSRLNQKISNIFERSDQGSV